MPILNQKALEAAYKAGTLPACFRIANPEAVLDLDGNLLDDQPANS